MTSPRVPYRNTTTDEVLDSFDLNKGLRNSGGFFRKFIIFTGVFIVIFAISDYVYQNRRAKIEAATTIDSGDGKPGQDFVFGGTAADHVLENPHLSWFDDTFCTGYRKSSSCSNKPLHPMYKYFVEEALKDVSPEQLDRHYGISPKETRIPGKRTEQVHARPQILNNL